MHTPIPALKGRNMTARGEAPGNASRKFSPALKGRHNGGFLSPRFNVCLFQRNPVVPLDTKNSLRLLAFPDKY
jgi:hypothetical protein